MDAAAVTRFDTRAGCEAQFRACVAASRQGLALFDPDFAIFPLGAPDVDTLLRTFLAGGGQLRLAMHSTAHIERHYPRFVRLMRDYGHLIECRMTGRSLRELADSFCIGDDLHIVRRFHRDHLRGEAAFHSPGICDMSRQRFTGIWEESRVVLQPTTIGL
ncbi:DUF7931 domain-containing protein [Massilia niastensis]|uniref:DUF7931 domain-containing protein n=1 Tax=Massilia niastensis TaxID=544911 RepID=UPI000364A773|nr:hypothetical protein [Massilia niastensis]